MALGKLKKGFKRYGKIGGIVAGSVVAGGVGAIALKKASGMLQAGKSVKKALAPTPSMGGFGGGGRRRSRSSSQVRVSKGRIFVGFSAKEVKNAMRRVYGGGRGRKK